MTSAGFEPSISACERPQTHAFDRAATGIGLRVLSSNENLQAKDFLIARYTMYTDSARPKNTAQVLRPVDG